MHTSRRPNAPFITGLGALIAVAMALPLLAPSCSDYQPGLKLFAKGSLIIPMDVCYQYQTDQVRTAYTPSASCPNGTVEAGDVIKAYGLVYQLIRNGVAVYWIINPDKAAVTPAKAALETPDLTLQFNGGIAALKYDWSGGPPSATLNIGADFRIKYLGGPFVIDGSDAVKAAQIFQKYRTTFRPTATTGVNVHVANVAFQASVAKMLAGGWSAGGATQPKLALLNIGSSGAGSKNSEVVIRGYLQKAGLDISEPDPANPTVLLAAGGSATGVHGTIYDRLVMEDFIPTAGGSELTTNLFKNGYQILWVPHWAAPTSCSDCPPGTTCTCANKYPAATIAAALRTIGAFGAAGKDIFAECAGLGSFEGVAGDVDYGAAVAETHFQTVVPNPLAGALAINTSVTSSPIYQPGYFASPLMQLGDYPFIPRTGAIQNYRPAGASTAYVTGGTDATVRLISESNGGGAYDIFTHRPGLKAGHGTFVYLGGHSYSGTDGSFEIGGTRLVLNTLFNLGAGCTESGVSCDTGLLGKCGRGVFRCASDGTTYCAQSEFPSAEICNGLDDNCNGLVDEDLALACYDGPAGTDGVGLCHGGVRSCVRNPDGSYALTTTCEGQVLPQPETCNLLDDNCDGRVDENLAEPCYDGPASSLDPVTGVPMGACKKGTKACVNGALSATCVGQVTPRPDDCSCPECGAGQDLDCDGQIAQCGACRVTDPPRACYTGPAGTAGVGQCRAGTQTCLATLAWGPCTGEVLPAAEICDNTTDEDCNGIAESFALGSPRCAECLTGASRSCYDGVPSTTQGTAPCHAGTQACVNGQWAACTGQRPPGPELCNGVDDDCDGTVDDGAFCGPGLACLNGVCTYERCDNSENPCAEGYSCSAGRCTTSTCGTGAKCPAGSTCSNGVCADPNQGLQCASPSTPAGGFCAGGGCYEAGCPDGSHCGNGAVCSPGEICADTSSPCPSAQLCVGGSCVADACRGVICPGGTFCRQGDCVQACALLVCAAGQRCDADGFCVADPCAGKSCAPTQLCVDGSCVTDTCSGKVCPRGQACLGGTCADDPCNGIACPVGQCLGGQCFAIGSSAGTPAPPETTGCGCASGGPGTPLALLALLAFAPLARGRRSRPRGGALLGLLLLLTAATGCKKTAPFDPASCTAPGVGLTACEGEDRCVDLVLDPSHCGACGRACEAGQTCVDTGCFPAGTVAPSISGVDPTTLPRGGLAPVRLTVTGARFAAGATVRATHLGGTTTYAANVLNAGSLSALIDLREAPAETWLFRVVNPDRVISNKRSVMVVVPTPTITDYAPKSHPTGSVVTIHLDGTGFMADSSCRIGGGTVLEQAVPTTATLTGLDCLVDLSVVQPGTFQLWVANPQSSGSPLLSLKKDFSATGTAAPTLTLLAPDRDQFDTLPQLRAYGTGFDASSQVVLVARSPAGTAEQAQSTTLVSPTELLVPSLDLKHCPGTGTACPLTSATATYAIKVENGTSSSTGELPYAIVNDAPVVGLSPAPTAAYQGETVLVTVSGTSLPAGAVLQYKPASSADFIDAPAATPPSSVAVNGTVDLIGTPAGSRPAGAYLIRLRYPSGAYSASLNFTVMSNTAILQTISPQSGAQGQNPVSVTLQVSNLRPPAGEVRVAFSARPGTLLVPTAATATSVTVPLDLGGLDTGAYTLQVQNPSGAQRSGPATFTVTPGPPTLASVACTAVPAQCPGPSQAPLQVARIPVTLTGSNFARPDVTGANGSTIHIYANCTPVIVSNPGPPATTQVTGCTCIAGKTPCIEDQPLSLTYNQVTVVSPARIDVLLDTATAFPATYSVWVWNPGGSPAPQRSPPLVDAFTITP
jgi:hypothetical protein